MRMYSSYERLHRYQPPKFSLVRPEIRVFLQTAKILAGTELFKQALVWGIGMNMRCEFGASPESEKGIPFSNQLLKKICQHVFQRLSTIPIRVHRSSLCIF